MSNLNEFVFTFEPQKREFNDLSYQVDFESFFSNSENINDDRCNESLNTLNQSLNYEVRSIEHDGNSTDGNCDYSDSSVEPCVKLPFEGDQPNINVLELIVRQEIFDQGFNRIVDDCLGLEIDDIEECADSSNIIRNKQKKTKSQEKSLMEAFKARPVWSCAYQQKLADKIGLSKNQVYKWWWDQNKKTQKPNRAHC